MWQNDKDTITLKRLMAEIVGAKHTTNYRVNLIIMIDRIVVHELSIGIHHPTLHKGATSSWSKLHVCRMWYNVADTKHYTHTQSHTMCAIGMPVRRIAAWRITWHRRWIRWRGWTFLVGAKYCRVDAMNPRPNCQNISQCAKYFYTSSITITCLTPFSKDFNNLSLADGIAQTIA